ncbi:MAG TPA: hypothetical protein VLH15_09020 [Dehalococcoidales bacterium]|nr:hypothetical protein [Dehalococcoidales bacterium]
MNIPPMLMRLKIINSEHHINLWLPLFLVWIVLLVIAIALSPIICILVLILWPLGWGETLLLAGPAVYRLICSARELSIDIRQPGEIVQIYFK